ncbi:hypothetical protein GUITHDRAFT_145929 [Guillardia theta CCMP2712]|uniref:Glutamine cyclotransferase n=1 Tax=Guillardia theta (strain CCMP2712) TaxID=905079 RepID=L1IKC0_GUITC|nr:hypothetical protein GUITHDRAFT_145929 [Guillardia theta CCMP2712]EKX36245.1 hypothetical protein GUITHDRAFT_145929 [Guillardia theta CCMP2712]|eukprot:XP_005823225.1 hypothetical protein GUITHDRAFT_145929 [Guillardia theta CCMP2712]
MTSNDQGPSSIEAWEAEYQALQARKGVVRSQPQQDGGFFGKIGQAFTQVLEPKSDPIIMANLEASEAKKGPRQLDAPPVDGFRVVREYQHVKESFTQGVEWVHGEKVWYEGSGGPSFSHGTRIFKMDLETGKVLQYRSLPTRHFGEGITVLGNKLYQLTWRSNVGFVYDKDTLELLDDFHYDHEGWGLTNNGKELIMSDGSATLYFHDAETLKETRKMTVRYLAKRSGEMTPLRRLNDLQWVKGKVFSNIWEADRIAVINPDTGIVERFIDLKGMLDESDPWIQKWTRSDRCLNGIAYDEVTLSISIEPDHRAGSDFCIHKVEDRLFVTGKMWTKIYEIEVVEGAGDKEEMDKKALPKDYYNPAGSFDPLGMSR